ncbi:MAG: GNAT family N-acetyltransferase [Bacteroidota bacterium]
MPLSQQANEPFREPSALAAEVMGLPTASALLSRGAYTVYLATADQIPLALQEIGRLREITFRAVGEGTGKEVDLDEYDQYYLNLFLWNHQDGGIAGGYRLGPGGEIMAQYGVTGFYLNSLFDIKPGFYSHLRAGVELGRSFIVEAYQKTYLPFFLLWSGILVYLLRNPGYQYLLGPVSISKYYSNVSKSVIVAFVKKHFFDEDLAKLFAPKTPYSPDLEEVDLDRLEQGGRIRDLESFLAEIEPSHLKVPTLIKQYTKMNARFVSFNLDPNFSDVLDGLMVLDIADIPPVIMQLLYEK